MKFSDSSIVNLVNAFFEQFNSIQIDYSFKKILKTDIDYVIKYGAFSYDDLVFIGKVPGEFSLEVAFLDKGIQYEKKTVNNRGSESKCFDFGRFIINDDNSFYIRYITKKSDLKKNFKDSHYNKYYDYYLYKEYDSISLYDKNGILDVKYKEITKYDFYKNIINDELVYTMPSEDNNYTKKNYEYKDGIFKIKHEKKEYKYPFEVLDYARLCNTNFYLRKRREADDNYSLYKPLFDEISLYNEYEKKIDNIIFNDNNRKVLEKK